MKTFNIFVLKFHTQDSSQNIFLNTWECHACLSAEALYVKIENVFPEIISEYYEAYFYDLI